MFLISRLIAISFSKFIVCIVSGNMRDLGKSYAVYSMHCVGQYGRFGQVIRNGFS